MAAVLALVAALVYLRDPPWLGDVTSGMRPWEENPPGTVFRWTTGRASFFIPGNATWVMLPLRSGFPGPNGGAVTVEVRVDDRYLATITLTDPDAWVRQELPLGRKTSGRRYRRIDLFVNRIVGWRLYGVMTGPAQVW
jgi:hypothetical protein